MPAGARGAGGVDAGASPGASGAGGADADGRSVVGTAAGMVVVDVSGAPATSTISIWLALSSTISGAELNKLHADRA